jgi:chaperonin GroES
MKRKSKPTTMTTEFEPLYDRILVARVSETETTQGGIIIPDVAQDKPQEGKVVAMGGGKMEEGYLRPMALKVGDRILFGKYAGTEIKIDGREVLIMREEEVFGRIRTRKV